MSLLISTVLSGSRNRLAPLVDAPCTMPGIDAAVLGLDDEHVAAVALGDDLILQVFRGLLAAQVRLERAAQPRALLAQALANELQLGARVDRRPRPTGRSCRATCAVSPLNDAAPPLAALEQRERVRRAADGRRALRRPNRETRRAPAAAAASSARPSTASAARICGSSARRAQRKQAVARRDTASVSRRGGQPAAPLSAGRSDGASRASRSSPIGVNAKPRDGLDDAIEFEGPQGARLHRRGTLNPSAWTGHDSASFRRQQG